MLFVQQRPQGARYCRHGFQRQIRQNAFKDQLLRLKAADPINHALIKSALRAHCIGDFSLRASQLKTGAVAAAEVHNKDVTPDLSGADKIHTLISQFELAPDAQFNYSILARVATQGPGVGEVALRIIAEGRANAAVEGGLVLYSSAATTAPGWDGHINRVPFVNGNTNFTSVVPGGYCNPDRTVRAECEVCADVG